MKDDPIRGPVQLIVTHQNPDLDAITSTWLLMRFGGNRFDGARSYFVPAGDEIDQQTLEAKELAESEVVHVDTGKGPFDHHQDDNTRKDSATLRVYEYLADKMVELADDQALNRLVQFVNGIDHFEECYWPEATSDRYLFMLDEVLYGLRSARHFNDHELVDFGMVCLDGVYAGFKVRVAAEADLNSLAQEFESRWGKALAIENQNDEVIKLAQKRGYRVVVRKDKEYGHARIKAVPEQEIDLTPVYEAIIKRDETGTWYFHPSKTMIINGSRKHSGQVPTPLTLAELVEVVKEIEIRK
jgi:hypothetical protein